MILLTDTTLTTMKILETGTYEETEEDSEVEDDGTRCFKTVLAKYRQAMKHSLNHDNKLQADLPVFTDMMTVGEPNV